MLKCVVFHIQVQNLQQPIYSSETGFTKNSNMYEVNLNNHIEPEQECDYFSYDINIVKWIFLNITLCILIKISLKFVSVGSIGKKSALFQVMAWHQIGAKSLPEPMMTNFMMPYGVTLC